MALSLSLGNCCETPVLNCLGCESPLSLPASWVMDFATAMSYSGDASGALSGSYTAIPPFVSGPSTVYTNRFWEYEWELPDLSSFGIGTVLTIDDAPLISPYVGFTECIWASNGFAYYWFGASAYESSLPGTCSANGQAPIMFKGSDYSNSSPWYYRDDIQLITAPAFSSNRVRAAAIAQDDARCGTQNVPGCSASGWQCSLSAWGAWAKLTVSEEDGVYTLRCELRWYPRIRSAHWNERYSINNTTLVRSGDFVITPISMAWWHLFGGDANGELTAFPEALAQSYLQPGVLSAYEATFDCETEFDGSPIVLTMVDELFASGAPQSAYDAIGILDRPETITLTPVI